LVILGRTKGYNALQDTSGFLVYLGGGYNVELRKLNELIKLRDSFIKLYLLDNGHEELKAAYQDAIAGREEEFYSTIDLYEFNTETEWKKAICKECSARASELLPLFKNHKENLLKRIFRDVREESETFLELGDQR
jgi:hypothetical protein